MPDAPSSLASAHGIIVPGVGHFTATSALDAEWIAAILARVGEGRPLLGICLGLQWLFDGSDESPELRGLGLLSGTCRRLRGQRDGAEVIKVPHVGWNSLELVRTSSILEGVTDGAQVYFTHSYTAPITPDTVAATTHGERFASVVQRGQVAGVQFHPEKSGEVGLQVLRNFLKMVG